MTEHARHELTARLKALLLSGDYSDLTVTCGSDIYKVHKAIVCAQSSFFKKAEKFPVGEEAAEGRIDFPEDDPHALGLLIQFFYENDYNPELPKLNRLKEPSRLTLITPIQDRYHYTFPHTCAPHCPSPNHMVCPHHLCGEVTCKETCVNFICKECIEHALPEGDASQLLLHAMMYEVADKYDVTGLRYLAQEKFSRSCEVFWKTKEFAVAAEHALTTTPDSDTGLRQVLYQTMTAHIELLNESAIVTLLHKYPGFTYGVLRCQAEKFGRLEPMVKTAS